MPENYLLVINGKPKGPFSLDQLKGMGIKPSDFVKAADMDDYKEVHEVAELRELLGFRQQSLIPQYFGSFDERLLASALDWLFISGACVIIALIAILFVKDQTSRLAIAFSLLIVIPLIKLIYHIIMESSAKQATYGKQILRIKVCDLEGRRLRLGHSTGRNLAKIFSILTLFIGYLYSFFNKQRQCLHDVIARTLVMKDRLI